jgi:capsular exopolysaccharide synthesis family protein
MSKDSLVTLTNPDSSAAEAYRTLRTNIEFFSVDEALRALLVTSPAPVDDKSATIANLAVAMADGERSVILVDADLRRPLLHTLVNLSNERGLTDLFRDEAAFNEPPLQAIPNTTLKVLTSGPLPPIPGQLLASKKMSAVVSRLTELAEVVIFDAPPLITVNDASLLASLVDGVLLVVRAGHTKRDYVKAAKERLERVNARLVGAVLTNAQVDGALRYS